MERLPDSRSSDVLRGCGQTSQYKGVLGTNLDGRHGEAHAAKGLTAFGTSLTRNRYF
jgi:hypothetical protein